MYHVRGRQEHVLLRCNVGLVGAADPLQVRNGTTGLDDNEFPSPGNSHGGFDGPVDGAVPVPVTGDEVHICTDHNPAIVHVDRATRKVETFLHVDKTWIRQRLVIWDERVQLNNRFTMAQGLEVITFNRSPSLFGRECKIWGGGF